MKLLDKIALNRLLSIITSFIISLIKLFAPQVKTDDLEDNNDNPWFPNLRKVLKRKKK